MTNIINDLKAMGYDAEIITVTKNGQERKGLRIGNDGACVVIYNYEHITVDGALDILADAPKIDADLVVNPDYILNNVIICVQQKSDEDIVKGDYLDLEYYFRVLVDDDGSYKITEKILDGIGVPYNILHKAAVRNLKDKIKTQSLSKILFGFDDDMPPYVVGSDDGLFAAGALMFTNLLKEFCEERDYKGTYILPSSIHELLLMPEDESTDIEALNNMVREVNNAEVKPEERLADHAYYYNLEADEITW